MKQPIHYFIIILLIFTSCSLFDAMTLDECENVYSNEFAESEKTLFPFSINDSAYYKEVKSGRLYYLTCISNENKIDSSFYEDKYCENGGYYTYKNRINIELTSDFPHFNDEYSRIEISLTKTFTDNSNIEILFEGYLPNDNYQSNDHYYYEFRFDNNTNLITSAGIYYTSTVKYIDSLIINNKYYYNINIIGYCEEDELNKYSFYDTIYYNNVGFLKFISSNEGLVFERVE